jgi:beta-lactamase class A
LTATLGSMTGLSRRHMLVGGLTLAAVAATGQKRALADPASPLPPINERLDALERRHNAIVGVHAVDIETGRNVSHRDAELFAVCSTFKTYAAAAVLQKSERGELALDQKVFVDPGAIVTNSPVTGSRAGGEMTLAELCQAALQVSDNTAGNLLLQAIGGPPAITEFARSIDDEATRLDRWETELNSAVPGDPRDTSTPHMIGRGYKNLLTRDVLGPPQRQQLEDWMRANQTSSMRAGLPTGWTSADKTGSGDYGSTNDVGVAYGPAGQRVLLAIMTRSQVNDPKAQNLRPLVGELTTLVIPELLA